MKQRIAYFLALFSVVFLSSCETEKEESPFTDVIISSNLSQEQTFLQEYDPLTMEYRVQTEGTLKSVALYEDGQEVSYQSETTAEGSNDLSFEYTIDIVSTGTRQFKVVATLDDDLTVEYIHTVIVRASTFFVELTENKTGDVIEDTDMENDSTIVYTGRRNTFIGYIARTETPMYSVYVNDEEAFVADTTDVDYEETYFFQDKEWGQISEQPQVMNVVVEDFFGNKIHATYTLNQLPE